MRHTLDMFIWDTTTSDQECIAVEVKFCKVTTGRMPTGEFQRMIGQSLLFRGKDDGSHNAVVSVFGVQGVTKRDIGSDQGMTEFLQGVGIWPVVVPVRSP